MNVKGKAVLSGGAAFVAAAAILAISTLAGVSLIGPAVLTSGLGTTGTLVVMITDPPHVPEGVTAVYVTYSDLAAHVSRAGNQSGWTEVSSGGTIELMSTVNVSETIASAQVPRGDYNALRLNISSAKVTYEGKNYTAFVVGAKLFIPIAGGGIKVNGSTPSATIIDISPFVLNIGSHSTPEFVIRHVAVAFPVPSNQITEEMHHRGFTFGLAGREWWVHFRQHATGSMSITGVSLSPGSLNVTVNEGSQNTTVKLVVVSPLGHRLGGGHENRMPSAFRGTAVFVVEDNGTLVPLHQYVRSVVGNGTVSLKDIREGLQALGFDLGAGLSATLAYSGPIDLGFSFEGLHGRQVVSGQRYLVTVIGTDALASAVVVAA